ncbi:calpastatin isoform X2 [Tenrec ecaudatus]|uniref:calpastatin isoform X2 n=1 Tax=Tenrec ecaudatus TaxID=94439 RepID=UPI003F59A629
MAFASWWYRTHANEKTSGSPSKAGEKKADEKKASSFGSGQASKMHTSGAPPSSKVSAFSAATSKTPSMNPTEAKIEGPLSPHKKRQRKQQAVKPEPEKSQLTKPSVVHEEKSKEEKPKPKEKEHGEPKSLPKHASDKGSKHVPSEKAASRSSEQLTKEKATEPKTKPQDTASASGKATVAAVTGAAGKPDDKKKEKKSVAPAVPVESKPSKPPTKSGMDAALDDLIDTLGEPEETEDNSTTYTGPEVSDPMISRYIEELGKREVTIPPKYRELLAKTEGFKPPADSGKPMGPDEAIDALSSDFTCSSPTTGGEKAEKEKPTGEVLKAQSAGVIRSAAPPLEKKRKVEEDTMSDQALDALSASLGTRKSEPELDLSSLKEVDEAKAREEKLKKCGEDEETVPSEFRLKPATDKDGKPLLPEPEEKEKLLSESELIAELSEAFEPSKSKEKPPTPTKKVEEAEDPAPAPVGETVSRASMCTIQSAPAKPATLKGAVPDAAVEALAGSLGKREADPKDGKPVVDKVKEKTKEESREKLGEKEETIPPDYRLEETKDKERKPPLPEEPQPQLPSMNEDLLLDALSEDFSGPQDTPPLKIDDAKLSAVITEVVSQPPVPATHSAGSPPQGPPQGDGNDLDDALEKLSDSLGQREPDPDENKPMEDKVKERAKAEHRDKLGERDDTIPPEYRHLLDNDDQGKPGKPSKKKPKEAKKPADDQDPIDTLSKELDSCPSTADASKKAAKDKGKKTDSGSRTPKSGGKSKESAKAKEEASKPKADEKNTS